MHTDTWVPSGKWIRAAFFVPHGCEQHKGTKTMNIPSPLATTHTHWWEDLPGVSPEDQNMALAT